MGFGFEACRTVFEKEFIRHIIYKSTNRCVRLVYGLTYFYMIENFIQQKVYGARFLLF